MFPLNVLLFLAFVHMGVSMHLRAHQQVATKSNARSTHASSEQHVEFLVQTLNRFKAFAEHNSQKVEQRHAAAEAKLRKAEAVTTDENTRLALEQSITSNMASKAEAVSMYRDMTIFFTSMEMVLGATSAGGSGRSCSETSCGLHATCTRTTLGAECVCDEGYQGDGMHCEAPAAFVPHQLLYDGAEGRSPQVQDSTVFVFGDRVAVIWRDITHGNAGYLKLGELRNNQVSFAPAERFAAKAFSPSVVGWTNGRLVVAYRDDDKDGVGVIRGAAIGISGVRGADMHLTWGKMVTYARNQAHQTALLAISKNRFILNYSVRKASEGGQAAENFGSSALGDVSETGDVSLFGTFRFAEQAITRIEATSIDDSSFVVAYRGAKIVDEMDLTKFVRQEASCIYGKVDGLDLVFYPHPLHLEPVRAQFWARSLALVAPNIFSYVYHSGLDQETKVVTVKVDPVAHTMTPISTKALRKGETPYVKTLPVPYNTESPHTVTFYQPKNEKLLANICSLNKLGNLSACEDVEVGPAMESFDAATLPSGRLLLVFAPSGIPYYQVVGLAKK
eukprot:GEMP01021910.1.p1 GENE.GEMP01021910.1~~GEMP01021910.1.p1  ORF type:complete len:561 (-),score=95.96 GEMP01021910.1:608-2290(-)